MARDPATWVGESERAIRQRWDTRHIAARVLRPDDPGTPPYVIHCAPGRGLTDSSGARVVPAHVTPDVIARYRAMCDRAVTLVGAADDLPGSALPAPAEQLACLPTSERYRTTDPSYVASVVWAFTQLEEAGLLYEAPHPIAWCSTCGRFVEDDTEELASEATSAIVRFPVTGDSALHCAGASLLVDVPEPWTVPATTAVRIDNEARYVLAQAAGDDYPVVLARAAASTTLGASATIHREVPIAELLSVRFRSPSAQLDVCEPPSGGPVITVTGAAATIGTGLVAVAPACSARDWRIAADHGLPIVDVVGADGRLTVDAGAYAGVDLGDADQVVVDDLRARGLVVRVDHDIGVTGRCGSCHDATVRRAQPAMLIATTRLRDRLRAERAKIAGLPITCERPWAAGDDDWPVARPGDEGLGLELWRCGRCAQVTAVDGRAPHAPAVAEPPGGAVDGHIGTADDDAACAGCGAPAVRRRRYVVDPIVVAAAMPFARFGFPAEPGSDTDVAHRTHADVMVDVATPPGRWTDAVIALSVLVWDAVASDSALRIDRGPTMRDAQDPAEGLTVGGLIDGYGVDAVRLAALAEPGRWQAVAHRTPLVASAARLLAELGAACDQFVASARHGPPFQAAAADVDGRHILDRWILAELSDTVETVRQLLDRHATSEACRRVRRFAEHLTQWYLPRQRSSRTHGGDRPAGADVVDATTHECLVTVAALVAPFAPLVSDALYEALVRADDPAAPDSVHLLRYPTADPTARNEGLRDAMTVARRVAALGERVRREAGVDARRLLPCAVVSVPVGLAPYWAALAPLLADALAVTRLHPGQQGDGSSRDPTAGHAWHTLRHDDLMVVLAVPDDAAHTRSQRLARSVVRAVNELRSVRAMDRDQRIMVRIDADPEVAAAVEQHRRAIAADVRATRIELGPAAHGVPVPLGDVPVRMALHEVSPG